MASVSQSRIIEWLQKIDGEPVPSITPQCWYLNQNVQATRTGNMAREGEINIKRSSLAPQQITHVPQELTRTLGAREKQHEYERRPRQKTKDDRYDYKGGNDHEKSNGVAKGKGRKSAKRKRRHTINDDFHASNVARNRLTLQSNMNLGLFQMGKTSSPVRARREADLKFSEMKFLSNGAGKSLKATSIHRGEAESRNVTCRNTTNLNTEHSLSLLDTAGEQARRWVYDGEKETISIAHADASNKHQKEGNSGLSQVTTQYTWSESVRARSELEDPFEFYTRQLLKVNLDTPKNSEKVMTEGNLDKRYWSLEELKCLLEHRKSFWDSEANDSVMSKIQGLPSNSRKRKCSLSIEQKIPAQSGKVRGNNRIRNNADQYNAIGALTRSHHGSAPALTAHPRGSEGINVDPMQMIHRQPEPASSQMYGHADIIEPSTSEYMLYPGTSSFTGSSLQFQKPKSTVQSCRTSGLSEPKISTSSAMGLDYTKSLMHYANETVPLLGGKYALIEQALSAAYDVIMHPEQDPLHRLQENQEIETAMRSDPSDVRSKLKESIFPVADDSYGSGLPEDLSWAASDTEIFLHNSHDTAEQKPHLSLTQPNRQHLIGDFPETRRSARGSPGMRVVETVFRPTMTMVSGLQEEIVSGLKGFWRQQKLY